MRIRVKIILSICITAMIIILSYVFFLVVKNHRDRLLMESYRQALESGARTAFKVEQKYLTQLTNDYSKWDEMVTFSKTGDSSWSKSNLSTMPGIHRLTKIWVFNLDKKLIYSKSRNGDRGDFSSLFTDSLFAYLSLTRSAYFFYKQNNRVYEISVSTIHPTQDTLGRLPPFGFFMICRLVDKTMLQDLEEVSGSTVTSLAQPETRTKKANLSEIIFVIPLPGWNNKPVGYLELSKYNPMLRSYLEITNATGIFYFILALVLLISVAFALYRWLNYPLKKIAESLALESSEKIKAMAVKKNEFGEIALMIERFFEQKKELAAIIQEKNGVLASLSDAESKNRAILSAIPDHLFRINLFGVITDFHINKTDDFIPDTRLVIGKNFEEVVPQHIVPMLQRAIQVVNSQKLPQCFDFSLDPHNQKTKYYEVVLNRTINGDYLAVVRNISTRKEAEMALFRMVEKEADLNRLKTQFISTVSHEFRTPLSAISSNCQLFELYGDKWPFEKKAMVFARIQEAVNQMTILLDELSVVARDQSGKSRLSPSRFNLEDFCRDIIAEVISVSGPAHSIVLDYQCKESSMVMDMQLLRHIFSNLLNNAVKFSPAGMDILFRVEDSGENQIAFSIEDKGIGITEQDLANIYEPFHRGGNVAGYPGTGLGLSIVKRCVDQHKGSVSMSSKVGEGTHVKVVLPGLSEGTEPLSSSGIDKMQY